MFFLHKEIAKRYFMFRQRKLNTHSNNETKFHEPADSSLDESWHDRKHSLTLTKDAVC